MYLYKDDAESLITDFKQTIISELKTHQEFILSLLEDDDWSLIIKSHALIESVVTDLIIAATEEGKLKPVIKMLPLHDEKIGKLKILKIYGLLNKEQRQFVRCLSELRNDLVHNFDNIDFTFSNHINTLDKNQKRTWKKVFSWYADDKASKLSWENASLENTKLAVWFSVYMLVSLIVVQITEIKGSTAINNTALKVMKDLIDKNV